MQETRRENRKVLPTDGDIKKLNDYVNKTMLQTSKEIEEKFDRKKWVLLGKSILIALLAFNRRRVGEMEQLKIKYVAKKHTIDKKSNFYNSLTQTEKQIRENYPRVELTGKRARDVHMLMHKSVDKCLEI